MSSSVTVELIIGGHEYDSNIWLYRSGASSILIDTGTGVFVDQVIQSLENLLHGSVLTSIILTHCHADHVGGAPRISSHFHCPVYIGSKDAAAVSTADERFTVSSLLGVRLMPLECSVLSEGDVINVGGSSIEVIDTPGHTSGGISLIDRSNGFLFSGDTLFSNGGFGRTDFPGGSFDQLYSSIRKLKDITSDMGSFTIYPGHGHESRYGSWAIDAAIDSMFR